ncbi:HAD family acid phosphatase [Sphingomonas ginsenosidivorax]|nr:HAD family acid phosphatase [Sphingomonas ginsenosidivorax]
MRRATLALATAALVLQGCAAAAIPVVAGGLVGRKTVSDRNARKARKAEAARIRSLPAAPMPAPMLPGVPPAMQYLYASGEAVALDLQAYMGLANYLVGISADLRIGHDVDSVVLAPGATLEQPKFLPCAGKPPAIVFDIDETAIHNLGFEGDAARRGEAYDAQRWADWERTGTRQVAVVPGLTEVIRVARLAKIAVVFNSNRLAENADATAAMLDGVGLGPVVHGDTLWLQGDAGSTDSRKDGRRWAIAAKYCVVAMSGDQLGDFSDLFNAPGATPAARREAAAGLHTTLMWGHGWFMLPNPVYGTGLRGGMDDVFPPATRWTPTPTPTPNSTPIAAPIAGAPAPVAKEK